MLESIGWARPIAAAIAALALSGCYETHVPVITAENALDSPIIANGRYCEATFDPHPIDDRVTVAAVRMTQCITLYWDAAGNGWRTDASMLAGNENGVAIRAMRLGPDDDVLGRSGLFVLQAGPTPRRIAMGGRSETVSRAHIMGAVVRDDMFALINARLPQDETIARALEHGIGLSREPVLLALHGGPIAGFAHAVGRWLAHELPREIRAAVLPDHNLERNGIRIFVRDDAPDIANNSPGLRARLARMLDAALFEAGVLDYELGLGLPAPRIDLTSLDASSARQSDPVLEQRLYNELMRCFGRALSISTQLSLLNSAIEKAENVPASMSKAGRDVAALEQSFLDVIGPMVKAMTEPPFSINRQAGLAPFQDGMEAARLPNTTDAREFSLRGALNQLETVIEMLDQMVMDCNAAMFQAEALIEENLRR